MFCTNCRWLCYILLVFLCCIIMDIDSSDTSTNPRSGWINRTVSGIRQPLKSHMSCGWFQAPLLVEVFEALETQFIKAVPAPCQTGFQIIAGLSTWIYVLLSRSKFLPIVYILYICIDIHCVYIYILIYYLYIIWHIDILKCYVRFSHSEPLVIPQYTIHRLSNWSSSPLELATPEKQKGHKCLGI